MDINEININKLQELLEDLHNRLVENYNNGQPFEQYEEDRLTIQNVIDLLDYYKK